MIIGVLRTKVGFIIIGVNPVLDTVYHGPYRLFIQFELRKVQEPFKCRLLQVIKTALFRYQAVDLYLCGAIGDIHGNAKTLGVWQHGGAR